MSDEWGPWIEHDGKGCPVRGQWVQRETRSGCISEGRAEMQCVSAKTNEPRPYNPRNPSRWVWGAVQPQNEIIRYRIRKPRALLDLIERVRELDDAPQGPVRVPGKEVVG